jgi:hypothetical protein
VLHRHVGKIRGQRPGYAFSWITLIAFGIMALSGFLPIPLPGFAESQNRGAGLHQWLYDNMMLPMQATMFSILAFFIASAAFRAFRARSFEATVLLIAGCIMMLGRVGVGAAIASATHVGATGAGVTLLNFPVWADWLFKTPNSAAFSGILLGVYLSQIAVAVRIIFGIERTYMGGGD